jgi:hypothetical protein
MPKPPICCPQFEGLMEIVAVRVRQIRPQLR